MICFKTAQRHAPNCNISGVFPITRKPSRSDDAFSNLYFYKASLTPSVFLITLFSDGLINHNNGLEVY